MSNKFDIQQDSGRLTIRFNRRSFTAYFMITFGLFWGTSLVTSLFVTGNPFLTVIMLPGAIILYFGLVLLVNTVTLTVDRRHLTLTDKPLPSPFHREKHISSQEIKQLYVDKSSIKKNNRNTYDLKVIKNNGEQIALLKGEIDIQKLRTLEYTIEQFLDITDDVSLNRNDRGWSRAELESAYAALQRVSVGAENAAWVPAFVRDKIRQQQARLEREMAETGAAPSGDPALTTSHRTSVPAPESMEPEITEPAPPPLDTGYDLPQETTTARSGQPRPIPTPDHDFEFPLYLQVEGTDITYRDAPYRLGRTAQIDWSDTQDTTARQLELHPLASGDRTGIYTQLELGRWAYYEERRLDNDEAAALGFNRGPSPERFDNGDDRYYPRDRQEGTLYTGAYGRTVEQYVYAATSSSILFRALRPEGGGWDVYVMEPVDSGAFAARN